jgi:hypothetical protein
MGDMGFARFVSKIEPGVIADITIAVGMSILSNGEIALPALPAGGWRVN